MNVFADSLAWSQRHKVEDMRIISSVWPGREILPIDESKKRYGFDYQVVLDGDAVVNIDTKRRQAGVSKYWRSGPELCVERWSVKESGTPGWTFRTDKDCDYIIQIFDKGDTERFFVHPFQMYQQACVENYEEWALRYNEKVVRNDGYTTISTFVPASVIGEEIAKIFCSNCIMG